MRLNFGPLEIDTRGLPEVFSIRAHPSYTVPDQVKISLFLNSTERSAVEEWAKYLGVEVVDGKPYRANPDSEWLQVFQATREVEDYRVRVWTMALADAPAEPVEVPVAGATVMHWPAPGLQITTLCQGERLTRASFADREADVTCPQCRALLPVRRSAPPAALDDAGGGA
jgi:hypothetical protein